MKLLQEATFVNIAEQERNSILNKKADEKIISEVMDAVLDDIVKQ